jgi:predicted HTH domain antitoxin
MPVTVQFDLPDTVASALWQSPGLRRSPEDLVQEIRKAVAVKWFETGVLSQEAAAELAGVSREAFHDVLYRYNISAFQTSPEELRQETTEEAMRFFDEVAQRARERGLTPEILDGILRENPAADSGE